MGNTNKTDNILTTYTLMTEQKKISGWENIQRNM